MVYDLNVLKKLTRYKDPPLQAVQPTKITMDWYGLGDASKRGVGSGLSIPKERSDAVEMDPEGCNIDISIVVRNTRVNTVTTNKLINLVYVVEEEVEAGRM